MVYGESFDVGDRVIVPTNVGERTGTIEGEGNDLFVGRVFIVRFRSGATMECTPQEMRHADD